MVQYQIGCKNVVVQPAQEYSLPDGAPWRTAELNWGRTAEEGSVRFPRVSTTLRGRDSGREKVNNDDGDQEKRNPSTTQGMRWSAA